MTQLLAKQPGKELGQPHHEVSFLKKAWLTEVTDCLNNPASTFPTPIPALML